MSETNQAPAEVAGEDTAAVLAALEGDKTYLPEKGQPEPEAQAEAPEETTQDDPGDDAAAAPAEAEAEKPKPKQTAQERIDELTRARREAEREAEFWRAKATQAQPAPEAQTYEPQGDGRPSRDDYQDDFEYIEALTDWKAEQAATRLAQQQRQQERVSSVVSNFETRAKTLFPDGEPAGLEAFRRIETLPMAVLEIVGESEVGPKIAEHLGANPAELARLNAMNPILQARELTRLEQRLEAPPKPAPKTATDAPEPPPQARGAGGRFTVPADTEDFAAFEKQYGLSG